MLDGLGYLIPRTQRVGGRRRMFRSHEALPTALRDHTRAPTTMTVGWFAPGSLPMEKRGSKIKGPHRGLNDLLPYQAGVSNTCSGTLRRRRSYNHRPTDAESFEGGLFWTHSSPLGTPSTSPARPTIPTIPEGKLKANAQPPLCGTRRLFHPSGPCAHSSLDEACSEKPEEGTSTYRPVAPCDRLAQHLHQPSFSASCVWACCGGLIVEVAEAMSRKCTWWTSRTCLRISRP